MKRKTTRRSSRRGFRFEQLEHRNLLAAAPVGPELTLVTNNFGTQETRVDSLAIMPNGAQIVHANTKTGNSVFAATSYDNEPLPSRIPPPWPATNHHGSVSPSGRILNVQNVGGFLRAAECVPATGVEPVNCGERTLLNRPYPPGTWDLPSWADFDVANRDDNSADGQGTEGLVIWAEAWQGSQTSSTYQHRIQARFLTNQGTPEPGQSSFLVPGSETPWGSKFDTPQVAMSSASGAAVVTWQRNDLPYFSLMQPNGVWIRRGVPALQSGSVQSVSFPSVSMADNGSFVMAWSERTSSGFFTKDVIGVQVFDSIGNPIQKTTIDVSRSTQSWRHVDVDLRPDGSFVVVAVEASGSDDIVYFDFDARGMLKPYHGGVNPVQQSNITSSLRSYVVDPNVLPRVNSDLSGIKENVVVEATSRGFVAAWSDHESDISRPWNVQSRLFAEETTDIVGRIAGTGRVWAGTVDLGVVDGELPLRPLQAVSFPDGNTWGRMLVGDFDGDGYQDAMARSNETGVWWFNNGVIVQPRGEWSTQVNWVNVTVGDFDGDGDDDIAGRSAQTGVWWVNLTNGSGQMTTVEYGSWSPSIQWRDVLPGDFNGDGRTDIVGRTPSGAVWVATSNGFSFTSTRWAVWSSQNNWTHTRVGDFNGDGLDDLLSRASTTGAWFVAVSQVISFSTSQWDRWSTNVTWQNIVVGDFNHDGRDDIAGRVPTSNVWWVAQSTGSSFVSRSWGQFTAGRNYVDVLVGDFTADGRDDIMGRDQATGHWIVGISSGLSFSAYPWGIWSPNANWTDVQTIAPDPAPQSR